MGQGLLDGNHCVKLGAEWGYKLFSAVSLVLQCPVCNNVVAPSCFLHKTVLIFVFVLPVRVNTFPTVFSIITKISSSDYSIFNNDSSQ